MKTQNETSASSPAARKAQTGILLVNLGTPDSPEIPAVRRYLREFLMDPYVIDVPWMLRFLLVFGWILPSRPAVSAEAYRKIWSSRGSPLKFLSEELSEKLREEMGGSFQVEIGMRYGNPSLESALRKFEAAGVERVVAIPLYPQYSLAATESSAVRLKSLVRKRFPGIQLRLVGPFYNNAGFLESFAEIAQAALKEFESDFLLFSFHGLPVSQIKKTDRSGVHCLEKTDCCEKMVPASCYRAQCYFTAHEIARRLDIPRERYGVSFQSRLHERWIKPFTDDLYDELPKKGVKRLAVISPAFVADCLETLEEIQIRGREQFLRAGGEELRLIPSLNSHPAWVRALGELVKGIK